MSNLICPISSERVDQNATRVTSGLTILALAAFATTGAAAIAAPLAADFAVRAWTGKTSPLQKAGALIARAAGLPIALSGKAPKQFAARIGFFFALATLILAPITTPAAVGVALTLMFFNVLAGLGNFCVGCVAYTYIVIPVQNRFAREA